MQYCPAYGVFPSFSSSQAYARPVDLAHKLRIAHIYAESASQMSLLDGFHCNRYIGQHTAETPSRAIPKEGESRKNLFKRMDAVHAALQQSQEKITRRHRQIKKHEKKYLQRLKQIRKFRGDCLPIDSCMSDTLPSKIMYVDDFTSIDCVSERKTISEKKQLPSIRSKPTRWASPPHPEAINQMDVGMCRSLADRKNNTNATDLPQCVVSHQSAEEAHHLSKRVALRLENCSIIISSVLAEQENFLAMLKDSKLSSAASIIVNEDRISPTQAAPEAKSEADLALDSNQDIVLPADCVCGSAIHAEGDVRASNTSSLDVVSNNTTVTASNLLINFDLLASEFFAGAPEGECMNLDAPYLMKTSDTTCDVIGEFLLDSSMNRTFAEVTDSTCDELEGCVRMLHEKEEMILPQLASEERPLQVPTELNWVHHIGSKTCSIKDEQDEFQRCIDLDELDLNFDPSLPDSSILEEISCRSNVSIATCNQELGDLERVQATRNDLSRSEPESSCFLKRSLSSKASEASHLAEEAARKVSLALKTDDSEQSLDKVPCHQKKTLMSKMGRSFAT